MICVSRIGGSGRPSLLVVPLPPYHKHHPSRAPHSDLGEHTQITEVAMVTTYRSESLCEEKCKRRRYAELTDNRVARGEAGELKWRRVCVVPHVTCGCVYGIVLLYDEYRGSDFCYQYIVVCTT